MKIITYNVNGLRAAASKGLPEWLVQENPDILCLQETKLQPDQYPAEVFEALGYKAYLYSAQKKGYSGVAILTKQEPDHVEYGMGIEAYDNEGRFIRADFGFRRILTVRKLATALLYFIIQRSFFHKECIYIRINRPCKRKRKKDKEN